VSAKADKPKADDPTKAAEPATPNVEHAFDPKKQEQLARAIEKLTPEEAQYFLWKLENSIKKRKIQLTGYLVAMVVWLIGMLFALAYYGMADGFVGWVFLAPFALVGVILFMFGKWGDAVGSRKPPPELDIKR
jgi:hypothetical protein